MSFFRFRADKIKKLHWHCPTCDHCVSGHELVPKNQLNPVMFAISELTLTDIESLDETVILCGGCKDICKCTLFPYSRTETLANMQAQIYHNGLWDGLGS